MIGFSIMIAVVTVGIIFGYKIKKWSKNKFWAIGAIISSLISVMVAVIIALVSGKQPDLSHILEWASIGIFVGSSFMSMAYIGWKAKIHKGGGKR